MSESDDAFLDRAYERVGRAQYGENWISILSPREEWLLARYVDRTVAPSRSAGGSIRSGEITYVGVNGQPILHSPSLQEEVARATDRREQQDA
jgi:hypothetical protein